MGIDENRSRAPAFSASVASDAGPAEMCGQIRCDPPATDQCFGESGHMKMSEFTVQCDHYEQT